MCIFVWSFFKKSSYFLNHYFPSHIHNSTSVGGVTEPLEGTVRVTMEAGVWTVSAWSGGNNTAIRPPETSGGQIQETGQLGYILRFTDWTLYSKIWYFCCNQGEKNWKMFSLVMVMTSSWTVLTSARVKFTLPCPALRGRDSDNRRTGTMKT